MVPPDGDEGAGTSLAEAYREHAKDMPRRRAIRLLDRIAPKLTQQEYLSLKPSFMKVFGQTLDNATNEINAADRIVDKIIHDPLPVIERPKAMGNKTGFGSFKSIFGDGLGSLKQMANEIGQEMQSVVAEGLEVKREGKELTDQAKQEIAEARETLAQFRGDNGGPA
jgi:hypothetical protein